VDGGAAQLPALSYRIGDRVELAAELGGLAGTIVDWMGGPGPGGSYRVAARYGGTHENDGATAGDNQIAALLPPPEPFEVGQAVTLAGEPAVVEEDLGDGRYVVAVEVALGRRRWARRGARVLGYVGYVRRHLVPGWRLSLEN
jgi:hypothetical protein